MREIKGVQQERGAGRRRWWESDDLDLVVWLENGPIPTGFQLLYNAGHGEHALTWREGDGIQHHRIDSGDSKRPFKATPVLATTAPLTPSVWREIVALFENRSPSLEPELRRFVSETLKRHPP